MKTRDRKITVSLAADLAQSVDKYVDEHPDATNRSKIVEAALRWWEELRQYGDAGKVFDEALQLYKKKQERELYRSYYADLSDEAKAEESAWREVGEETASRLMDKHAQ
jgi:metal-responsive CopG/Arc/MetJ family transcriptional regulator